VFYVDALFGIKPSGLGNWGIALVGLWVPAAVNLAGIRQTAWLQNVTVVLKYLPLLFVGVVGGFFVTKANFARTDRARHATTCPSRTRLRPARPLFRPRHPGRPCGRVRLPGRRLR
jgi:amino acid transporter